MPIRESRPAVDLAVRAPDPVRDRDEVFDLCAKTFGRPYYDFRRYCEVYFLDPVYDWANSRVGFIDGKMVTHWGVWRHRLRVGRARPRVAGIGCVACDARFRNMGLLSRTAEPSLASYAAAGYDLAMLFGIPDFYHRFGFVRAASEPSFRLTAEALAALVADPESARLPERVPEDRRADIDALYNAAHARATGTIVRPFQIHKFPGAKTAEARARGRDAFYAWTAPASGRRPAAKGAAARTVYAGYVAALWDQGEARLTITETAGGAADALATTHALARDWGAREVVFESIPPDGPVAVALRRGSVRETVEHQANGGAMVRIESLAGTLAALQPELAARWKATGMSWEGTLQLAGMRESASLRIGSNGVEVVPATVKGGKPEKTRHVAEGGMHLPQLLLGTHGAEELAANGTVRFGGEALRLARTLFPPTRPAIARLDRY